MIIGKRGTKELFIQDAQKVHGDKYDYSKVVYVNNHTKVCIICPQHGEFYMTPMTHLQRGKCRYCSKDERRRIIYGVAVNDTYEDTHTPAFAKWYNMVRRCYDKKYHAGKPTYSKATVCEEWKLFSNFKKWFDVNHIEGYHLDKDILVKGNTIYSPDTCCFVPNEINVLLTKSDGHRGNLPLGVKLGKSKKRYEARLSVYKGYIHLGTFDTVEDAFLSYKKAKEDWIKKTAKDYFNNGLIAECVYKALLNYKVEIND